MLWLQVMDVVPGEIIFNAGDASKCAPLLLCSLSCVASFFRVLTSC